jgi:hypothetical protein
MFSEIVGGLNHSDMIYAIYDLEISKAIPPDNAADRLPDIQYCGGWTDFEGMGISVAAICYLDTEDWSISQPQAYTEMSDFLGMIDALPNTVEVGGFDSRDFDDKLIRTLGHPLLSDFDILLMTIEAAGLKGKYWEQENPPSYKLADIAMANGYGKTLTGEQAPIEWQRGNKQLLIDYCKNNVCSAAETLKRLMRGALIDPNTGNILVYRRA